MRLPSRIAVIVAAAIVAVVAILAIIPVFFGSRISDAARTYVNKSVDARVAWDDLSLSLLRGFPHATLSLGGLSVAGVRTFERDTLLTMRRLRFVVDVRSVLGFVRGGAPITIRELSFEKPVVHLRRLADGRANWNITRPRPATSTAAAKPFNVSLRHLGIDDATITLDDRQSNLAASIDGFNEALSGDFTQQTFTLATRTRADSVSATFAGIPYLHRVSIDLNANVAADMRTHRFALARDTLRLNKLLLALSGTVTTGTPDLDLDVSFAAPTTAFADILSLVPAIYARDFNKLLTSGTMAVSGQVRGKYGPKAFPAFAIRARVDDGAFKYPDLPLAARAIALDLAANNPGGHVDSTVIDLKRFHAVLGNRPIDASLLVRTPVGDPDASLRLKGSVDLADVVRTVKLEGVTTLTGVVAADMSTHARVSDIDAHRYDRVAASGGVQASHVVIRTSSVPHPIAIDTAALAFTPQNAKLTTFAAKIGNSDIRANGSLDNVLGFVLRNEDLRGSGAVSSNSFDLDEWKSSKKTTEVIPVPPHVDFTLAASAARVIYSPLTLTDVKGTLEIKNQRVSMQNLTMQMLHGAVTANGYYDTVNEDRPAFSFDIGLTTLDIPAAFTSIAMIRQFAPIAKYAQGRLSGKLSLAGPIGRDMSPVLTALAGKGEITTDSLMLHNAPVTQKLSGAVSLPQLASPAIPVFHAAFDLADGRLHVKPFKVGIGGVDVTASGSNGIDQSVAYDLALAVPRNLLGPAATSTIARLASKAGAAGAQLPAGDVVQLRAKLTGSVTNPSIATDFAGMAASMKDATRAAAQQIATSATAAATKKVDSAAAAAKEKAAAETAALVAQAQRQADSIRAAGKAVADRMRQETNARIDSLVGKASNPIAKLAAQKAADRMRAQTNDQADKVVQTANARADSLVSQAKQRTAIGKP